MIDFDDTPGAGDEPLAPTKHQWAACQDELQDPYDEQDELQDPYDEEAEELAQRFLAFGQKLQQRAPDERHPVDVARDALKRCVVTAYQLGDFEEATVSLRAAHLQDALISVVRVPAGCAPGETRVVFWAELDPNRNDGIFRWRFELVNLRLVDLRPSGED
jgi:hypothetical protein